MDWYCRIFFVLSHRSHTPYTWNYIVLDRCLHMISISFHDFHVKAKCYLSISPYKQEEEWWFKLSDAPDQQNLPKYIICKVILNTKLPWIYIYYFKSGQLYWKFKANHRIAREYHHKHWLVGLLAKHYSLRLRFTWPFNRGF